MNHWTWWTGVAVALALMWGCAGGPGHGGDGRTAGGGSGITVFGTVDAAVGGTRNR